MRKRRAKKNEENNTAPHDSRTKPVRQTEEGNMFILCSTAGGCEPKEAAAATEKRLSEAQLSLSHSEKDKGQGLRLNI
jgi:hypothetical protein